MRFEWPLKDRPPADLPAGLVDDLYEALRVEAYEGGRTARAFLPTFDELTVRHGWEYQGPRRNRNGAIYQLATRAFYAHRRYVQQTAPVALELYPYWKLDISDGRDIIALQPPQHHARLLDDINGLIVPADCRWIRAYLSIDGNHWAVSAVVSLGRLERHGEQVSEEPFITYYSDHDPVTGQVVNVPVGVMPGFQKDIRCPMEDYVKHFIRLSMILPVHEKEEWY